MATASVIMSGDSVNDGLDAGEVDAILKALATESGLDAEDIQYEDTLYMFSTSVELGGVSSLSDDDKSGVQQTLAAQNRVDLDAVEITGTSTSAGRRRLLQVPTTTVDYTITVSESASGGSLDVAAFAAQIESAMSSDSFVRTLKSTGVSVTTVTAGPSPTIKAEVKISVSSSNGMSVDDISSALSSAASSDTFTATLASNGVVVDEVEVANIETVSAASGSSSSSSETDTDAVIIGVSVGAVVVVGAVLGVYMYTKGHTARKTLEMAKFRFMETGGSSTTTAPSKAVPGVEAA